MNFCKWKLTRFRNVDSVHQKSQWNSQFPWRTKSAKNWNRWPSRANSTSPIRKSRGWRMANPFRTHSNRQWRAVSRNWPFRKRWWTTQQNTPSWLVISNRKRNWKWKVRDARCLRYMHGFRLLCMLCSEIFKFMFRQIVLFFCMFFKQRTWRFLCEIFIHPFILECVSFQACT